MPTHEPYAASRPGYPPMVTHTITVGTDPKTFADVASCGEYTARSARGCAARNLARTMMDAGEADGPIEARGPDGAVRYRVRSLFAFAGRTLVEGPRLHTVRWRPLNINATGVGEAKDGGSEGSDGEGQP